MLFDIASTVLVSDSLEEDLDSCDALDGEFEKCRMWSIPLPNENLKGAGLTTKEEIEGHVGSAGQHSRRSERKIR